MNENDLIRLHDMLSYARDAVRYTAGQSQEDLDKDEQRTRGLIYTVGVIGEAAAGISREFQSAAPQIPWPQVISMRNRLFHGYRDVKYERLWYTVTVAIPELIIELEKLIPPEVNEEK